MRYKKESEGIMKTQELTIRFNTQFNPYLSQARINNHLAQSVEQSITFGLHGEFVPSSIYTALGKYKISPDKKILIVKAFRQAFADFLNKNLRTSLPENIKYIFEKTIHNVAGDCLFKSHKIELSDNGAQIINKFGVYNMLPEFENMELKYSISKKGKYLVPNAELYVKKNGKKFVYKASGRKSLSVEISELFKNPGESLKRFYSERDPNKPVNPVAFFDTVTEDVARKAVSPKNNPNMKKLLTDTKPEVKKIIGTIEQEFKNEIPAEFHTLNTPMRFDIN